MGTIKWLLATRNKGKLAELRKILAPFPVELLGLDDLDFEGTSPESGQTFLDNAMQKAHYYWRHSGIPVLSDDSGLEVDALGGAPGIHSARFGGLESNQEKIDYLLSLLEDVDGDFRSARFTCAAVFYDGMRYISAEGTLEGFLTETPQGVGGFGYDPIFQVENPGPTLAEIPMEEKNRISHRGKAFKELVYAILKLSDVNM